MEKAKDRLEVLAKIEEFERNGIFDVDVENDPPFERSLLPNEVDFLRKKLSSKIKTYFANKFGKKFYDELIDAKQVIYKGCVGLKNLKGFKGGAVITCNHIHIFDNYAVHLALSNHFKNLRLFKFLREGNYFFPGKIGFFMKNCNTLPLSKNLRTMQKCLDATEILLKRGKKILVYPEQAMWWNYRKPRPLKDGAFRIAAKANVPIIPCFITLNDSDIIGADGFNVQEFTVHILPLIYPDKNLSVKENCRIMKEVNAKDWKETYEKVYNKKLEYLTK